VLIHCFEPGHYCDPDGALLDARALAGIAAAQELNPVTLVLPLRYSMVSELMLAVHERRYLARTLPWRFEEQLVEPVESLHFASVAGKSGQVLVTALPRRWLQALLDDLATQGIRPVTAVSELELLPWQEGEWTLWCKAPAIGQPASILLRHDHHRALVCTEHNLAAVLQSLADEQAALPRRIRLHADRSAATALQSKLPAVMQGLVEQRPANWGPVPETFCNVLQGEFAPSLPWGRWWRQWRMVAVLLLALLLADIAFTGADVWRAQRHNESLRLAINTEAARVLPGAVLVDPLLQLRRAVVASGGGDHGGMLSILTRMTPVFQTAGDVRVQSLDYNHDNGELQLVIESSGFAAVESLRAGLQAQGLQAELLGSSSDGSLSRSRLRVKA
jgi:general secretion pathway protein L